MKLLYGITVPGAKQVEPLHGAPTDNFCIDGRFHIGISRDAPVPGSGWHVSVLPYCTCSGQRTTIVANEVFIESVAQVITLIGKPLHWLGPSPVGVFHWDEIPG